VLALDAGGGVPVVMAGLLLACGALMVAEHFTRRVVFDREGFVVHSLRGPRPRVAWADVVRWEPDSWFGYHYVTTTRGVICLSIWLSGVPDFEAICRTCGGGGSGGGGGMGGGALADGPHPSVAACGGACHLLPALRAKGNEISGGQPLAPALRANAHELGENALRRLPVSRVAGESATGR
jgi:hypothetical protein